MNHVQPGICSPGTTSRDVPAASIPTESKAAVPATLNKGRFRRFLEDYPFHSASILAPLTASIVIGAGAGLTFARGLMPTVADNLPAIGVAISGLTFSLTATLTVSTLKALAEIKEDLKTSKAKEAESTARATSHESEQHVVLSAVDGLAGRVDDLTNSILVWQAHQGPKIEVRPNTSEAWMIAPNSDYIAAHGNLRFDLEKKRAPNRNQYEFDLARIRAFHLPRYTRNGARRITIILPAPGKSDAINEANLTHVLLFRTIAQVADEDGIEVDFSKVQFALVDGPVSQNSFFVGTRLIGGQPIDFVNTYTDLFNSLQVPRTLLDNTVQVSVDPGIVDAYQNTAKVMIERAEIYSYEELEQRFAPHLPPRKERKQANVAKQIEHDPDTFVVNCDHFVWNSDQAKRT